MRRRNRCAGAFRDRAGAFKVIGKVVRGRNAARLLYYLYGPGKANEHTDSHLVAAIPTISAGQPPCGGLWGGFQDRLNVSRTLRT